jgi:hypothetical protein
VQCCPQLKDAGSTGKTLNKKKVVIETTKSNTIMKAKRLTIKRAMFNLSLKMGAYK